MPDNLFSSVQADDSHWFSRIARESLNIRNRHWKRSNWENLFGGYRKIPFAFLARTEPRIRDVGIEGTGHGPNGHPHSANRRISSYPESWGGRPFRRRRISGDVTMEPELFWIYGPSKTVALRDSLDNNTLAI